MKPPVHVATLIPSRTITLTLGDVIASAYEVSDGFGRERARRASLLLAGSSVALGCKRRLEFVR